MNKTALNDEALKSITNGGPSLTVDVAAELLRTRHRLQALASIAAAVLDRRAASGESINDVERKMREHVEAVLGPPKSFMPDSIDLTDYTDRRGIRYLGRASRQEDGTYQCLANVDGALCIVEVKITVQPKTFCPTCGHEYAGPLSDYSAFVRLKNAASDAIKYMGTAAPSMQNLSDVLKELNK